MNAKRFVWVIYFVGFDDTDCPEDARVEPYVGRARCHRTRHRAGARRRRAGGAAARRTRGGSRGRRRIPRRADPLCDRDGNPAPTADPSFPLSNDPPASHEPQPPAEGGTRTAMTAVRVFFLYARAARAGHGALV